MATEKRLIDANAYPCQTCEVSHCYQNCNKFTKWFESTVDAVEVVQCKDCEHYKRICEDSNKFMCMITHGLIAAKADDFCSYGERRQEK